MTDVDLAPCTDGFLPLRWLGYPEPGDQYLLITTRFDGILVDTAGYTSAYVTPLTVVAAQVGAATRTGLPDDRTLVNALTIRRGERLELLFSDGDGGVTVVRSLDPILLTMKRAAAADRAGADASGTASRPDCPNGPDR